VDLCRASHFSLNSKHVAEDMRTNQSERNKRPCPAMVSSSEIKRPSIAAPYGSGIHNPIGMGCSLPIE
jgi:hypothetical protein